MAITLKPSAMPPDLFSINVQKADYPEIGSTNLCEIRTHWLFCFFFQAEDGIRYHCVTGVQTCALPISRLPRFSRVPPPRLRPTSGAAKSQTPRRAGLR